MSLRTVVIDPPMVFTYTEKRMTGFVAREVAGVVELYVEWETPVQTGQVKLQTVRVSQAVVDLWMGKPAFGNFLDAIRDDTQ